MPSGKRQRKKTLWCLLSLHVSTWWRPYPTNLPPPPQLRARTLCVLDAKPSALSLWLQSPHPQTRRCSDHFLRIHKIASSFTIQIRFRFNLPLPHTWDVCLWLLHVISVVVLVVLVVALTCVFHESNVANQTCHFSSNNSIPARLLTRLLELSSPPSNSLVLLDGSAVSIRTS